VPEGRELPSAGIPQTDKGILIATSKLGKGFDVLLRAEGVIERFSTRNKNQDYNTIFTVYKVGETHIPPVEIVLGYVYPEFEPLVDSAIATGTSVTVVGYENIGQGGLPVCLDESIPTMAGTSWRLTHTFSIHSVSKDLPFALSEQGNPETKTVEVASTLGKGFGNAIEIEGTVSSVAAATKAG